MSLVAGYTPISYVASAYEHSERSRNKDPSAHFRAGYAYRAFRALEIGGAVTTAFSAYTALLLPQGTVRGFLTFTEHPRIDAGLSARVGLVFALVDADLGLATAAGADVRIWPTPNLAISLGTSAGFANGTSNNPGHAVDYYTLGSIELGVTVAP